MALSTVGSVSSLVQQIGEMPPETVVFGRSDVMQAVRERLDKLAASRFPDLSRARVQQLIVAGLVDVDGAPAAASDRPRAGAQIRLRLPEVAAPRLDPVRLDLPVLYEDPYLLVIDKPAGLAVHPGAGGEGATIVHGLLHQVRDLRGGPASIPATLTQGRPFYAMVESWKGGAIRKSGALLAILQAAAGTGQVVKFELANARLQFGSGSTLAVESATVRRATDHALR